MGLAAFIAKYRENRRILLFIVYIALFLDNMLLTTVVPIIPEYLLRLSHPNSTDMLLYNKPMPTTPNPKFVGQGRGKRQIGWDDEAWEQSPSDSRDEEPPRKSYRPKMPEAALPSTSSARPGGSRSDDGRSDDSDTRDEQSEGGDPAPVTLSPDQKAVRHKTLTDENVHVGLLFGSKALVQLITNPFIGPLTNRIGYTVPMFTGFCIMFLSTLMFAFGSSYFMLWLARALQGVGSACTSTSGMGMVAHAYPDDAERGSAMGIALGGLALGVLVGPPFGGVLYEWSGKELPFLLLAMLALFDGTLQFMVLQPHVDRGEPEGTSIKELIKDPYVIIAAGSITIGNLGIAMLEPSLPLWMMETWQAGSFERGAAFLPASISYLVGTNIFGPLAHRIGRWLSGCLGLIIIGFCLLSIPSATNIGGLIAPNLFMGFSIGMIDASMFPQMGYLVDLRHVGVYGSIYAIADAAFCFAFAIGPFISGPLVRSLGFPTMMYIIAVINFMYAPLMIFLRDPPAIVRGEKQQLMATMSTNGGVSNGYEKFDNTTDSPARPVAAAEYDPIGVWDD